MTLVSGKAKLPTEEPRTPSPRRCLLVLGSHRSGTSALTRVLSLMGAALPRRMMGGGAGNESGHWEGARLVQYHDQLLTEYGSDWSDWQRLHLERLPVARREQMKADIRQILQDDYADKPLIVVKDPRICRFASLFIECLAEAGYQVVPVIAFRNPLEVIDSLQKRKIYWPEEKTRQDAALLWLSHQLESDAATRNLPRVVIRYDQLLTDWQAQIAKIEQVGQFNFPVSAGAMAPEVDAFLDEGRRHQTYQPHDVHLSPDLQGWISDAFDAFTQLARSGESDALRQRLDALMREFSDAEPMLGAMRAERRQVFDEAQALRRELARHCEALEHLKKEAQAHGEQMDTLKGELVDHDARAHEALLRLTETVDEQAERLEQTRDDLAAAQAALSTRLADIHILEASIKSLTEQNDRASARFTQSMAELEHLRAEHETAQREVEAAAAQISGLHQQLLELENARIEAQQHATQLQLCGRKLTDLLNAARIETSRTHDAYRRSTSWRVTAPLRAASALVRGRGAEPAVPGPVDFESVFAGLPTIVLPTVQTGRIVSGEQIVYFTICSRNFMAFARTLHQSLARFYPQARFIVALCDDQRDAPPFVAAEEPFEFLYLDDLDMPDWREMSQRYNVTEFNTAIKPFVFQHLFEKEGAAHVVYFDPDIYVVDHIEEIESAFGSGADVILTPHMLEPNERAEMNERRLLQYGIYNLGFVGIANTAKARDVVRWWGRRLERECIIKRDEGLFVDQKWADHFPAFFEHPHILHHPGYNIAYWNLSNRKVTWNGQRWLVNGLPARFVHFSGNNLDDPKVLSRHSGEHRAETIGELKVLLDEYRDRVFANGHKEFRKIPYAFSWGGATGVNEHTPKPAHEMHEGQPAPVAPALPSGPSGTQVIRTAMDIVGGPGKLLSKTAKVIATGDIKALQRGIANARNATIERAQTMALAQAAPIAAGQTGALLPYRKNVLVLEWQTPHPDSDSGSRTVFFTIEILALLGYRVTFLPANLLNDGKYTQNLQAIGVRCIDARQYASVSQFLEAEGSSFDTIMLNRVSVVAPHMEQIHRFCPEAKLVFNTVDLHYIRELRDAELNGQPQAEALKTKATELGIVRDCDLTIVLSHAEKDILQAEVPEAKIEVLPLVFSELDTDPPGFDARADILFIGSFPHKPNVDAVLYFANEIFPVLRQQLPEVKFHVVGSEPTPEVLALAQRPGIIVHGFVDDITPLFRSVRLTVAPLRFGAGIKGKIATSLSYGVPSVCTQIAAEGMRIGSGKSVLVAETVDEWVTAITSLYHDRARWTEISSAIRQIAVEEFSLAANTVRIGKMMAALDPDLADNAYLRFANKEEFDRFRSQQQDDIAHRQQVEKALLPSTETGFDIDGFCAICGAPSTFKTSYMYSGSSYDSGEKRPNWREHLACNCCGFTMRLRAAMELFQSRVYQGAGSSIYITEQKTRLFKWLKELHPALQGSEYLGDACAFGTEKDGLRNEDMTNLSFASASFDTILSFDVLEHVADDIAAFRECYRCLKPGGTLLFTAPFSFDKAHKVVRARFTPAGGIEHILPPEYHGNPVDPKGALCLRYFAWDVVEDLRAVGFESVDVMHIWSRDFAYLGNLCFVIIARKGL